jgi:hypothetical protein
VFNRRIMADSKIGNSKLKGLMRTIIVIEDGVI